MPDTQRSGPTFNTRLAKAESILLVALVMDAVVSPWILSHLHLQPAVKTLCKMLIVIGVFGPMFKVISELIDSSLTTTRKLTTSTFSMPKMATHTAILLLLFLGFYWHMHQSTPWHDMLANRRQAVQLISIRGER